MSNTQRSTRLEDLRANYNGEQPQARFKVAGLAAAQVEKLGDRLPGAVPWPAGKAPTAVPLATVSAEADDLTKLQGYDTVVVTWVMPWLAKPCGRIITSDGLPSALPPIPSCPNPNNDPMAASQTAAEIYAQDGAFTTAASVIASWAVIDAIIN